MKKQLIKRQVNKNLLLSLIVVMMLLVMVVGAIWLLRNLASDEAFMWATYGVAFFAYTMLILWIVVAAVVAFFIFIFAVIARLVYDDTPQRIMAYRILMGFSYAGQIFILFECLEGIFEGGWGSVVSVACSALIFWIIFMGMRGTYTERLKES